ncbi:hypothetical protein [Acinetobacter pullicarnis]|nr:hypothetical protein [Acinetobacter pullicarnis]
MVSPLEALSYAAVSFAGAALAAVALLLVLIQIRLNPIQAIYQTV